MPKLNAELFLNEIVYISYWQKVLNNFSREPEGQVLIETAHFKVDLIIYNFEIGC